MNSNASPYTIGAIEQRARVVIVDDHEMLSEALAFSLSTAGTTAVSIPPDSEQELIVMITELEPDVAVLDLHLGTFGPSLDLIRPLSEIGVPVVIMTGETRREIWGGCIEAGAVAVVSKVAGFEELVATVTRAADRELAMPENERLALLEDLRQHRNAERVKLEPFRRLTVRESEVLHELINGKNVETICEEAFVSIATVRSHVRSILQKLGVNSQIAAVALARRADWAIPSHRQGKQ